MGLFIAVICISLFLIFSCIIDTQIKYIENILEKNENILNKKGGEKNDK